MSSAVDGRGCTAASGSRRLGGARRTHAVACGLAAVAMALLAAGCVTARSQPPDFDRPWPPIGTGPRPAAELVVTDAASESPWPRTVGPIFADWVRATERAYRESALFSDLLPPGQRADIRIDVALNAEVHEYPPLAFFSYLTLFLIPNVETTEIIMTTRVLSDRDQPLGTIEVRGRSRTWYQFLLFPFAPFFEPRTVTPEIVYDLNRETITNLHDRGIF